MVFVGLSQIDEDPHSVLIFQKLITNEKNELIYMSRLALPRF